MDDVGGLAVIIAVDVLGYSRRYGAGRAGASTACAPVRHRACGRIVKTIGDRLLLEFP